MQKDVNKTVLAIQGFVDPFNPNLLDKDRLYNITSGAPVADEISKDVLNSERIGENCKLKFINERLNQKKDFFEKIPKLKLKTMSQENKCTKLTASAGLTKQFQEQGDVAFMILVKSQTMDSPIDLNELMEYSLTPVPHSLGTPDGYMAKTNKAVLLHHIIDAVPDSSFPDSNETMYIEDGNAIIHSLTGLPGNFTELTIKILNQFKNKTNTIFSTDRYIKDSVKSQELFRRGVGTSDPFIISKRTTLPREFTKFLTVPKNKLRLFEIMLEVLNSDEAASDLEGKMFYMIVDGNAFKLSSDGKEVSCNKIDAITSTQEETDTRVVVYIKYAKDIGFKNAIVRTPDSDILFILLHYAEEMKPINIFYETVKLVTTDS